MGLRTSRQSLAPTSHARRSRFDPWICVQICPKRCEVRIFSDILCARHKKESILTCNLLTRRDLWSQGVARYTDEQKLQLARDDLSALSSFLGSKKTFFDDGQVHELDIVVYTMLSNYLLISLHTPLTDVIKEFSNLCEFAERMDKKFLQK